MTLAIEHEQDIVLLEVVLEDVVQMVEVMVYLGEVALFNKEFLILVEKMILLEEDVVQLMGVVYEDVAKVEDNPHKI